MTRAFPGVNGSEPTVDLERRRDQLSSQLAELQWDLGGLAYEMATRDRIKVDLIVKQAAAMQDVEAELSEIERIMKLEKTSVAGTCSSCGAAHSSGAAFCWQCGQQIMHQADTAAIFSAD